LIAALLLKAYKRTDLDLLSMGINTFLGLRAFLAAS